MGQSDEAVAGIIYLLVALIVATILGLVALDRADRHDANPVTNGWRTYKTIRGGAYLSTLPTAQIVSSDPEAASGAIAKDSAGARAEGLRSGAQCLVYFWALLGVGLTLFLLINYSDYVTDGERLTAELISEDRAELSAADLVRALDGNASAPLSLVSRRFVIPAPLALAVLRGNFDELASNDTGLLFGEDWKTLRCEAPGASCVDLTSLLSTVTAGGLGAEVIWVAAPVGTDGLVLGLLSFALLTDVVLFCGFGCHVWSRARAANRDPRMRFMPHTPRAFKCEVCLFVFSALLLAALLIAALQPAIEYEALAFVSPIEDPRSATFIVLRPQDDSSYSVQGSRDLNFAADRRDLPLSDWCPTAPQRTLLGDRYELVLGSAEAALLTGPTADSLAPGCVSVGGSAPPAVQLASADDWRPLIEYVERQVLGQGATVDGLLLVMDLLMLVAVYGFVLA